MRAQFLIIPMLLALLAAPGAAQFEEQHVRADLLADVSTVQPGTPFTVALRLRMDPHWHVYWRNPGESGLPTSIDWTLPDGYTAGPMAWPVPRTVELGGLVSYAYENEVVHPVRITPPADAAPGEITLRAEVRWLECKEICLPGDATLTLTLPVRAETPDADTAGADIIADARAALPAEDHGWTARGEWSDDGLVLALTPPDDAPHVEAPVRLFPITESVIAHGAEQSWTADDGVYYLHLAREETADSMPDRIAGVLQANAAWTADGARAIAIDAPLRKAGAPAAGAAPDTDAPAQGADAAGDPVQRSLIVVLGAAFLSGLILNLMPCVFPVISLKILGFVEQAQDDAAKIWRHGLIFAAGVVVSFWVLAAVVLGLRASGQLVGWGFQMGNPAFLIAMVSLFTLLSLNLFGVFEVGMGLTSAGQGVDSRTDWRGTFLSGCLATIIATPCTAPFMGPALFYALSSPAWASVLVFTSLALGMAAPYLVLSRFPGLLDRLPRPGAWMESLKQFLGFLLLATAVWLADVLRSVSGPDALRAMLFGMVLMGLGAWVFGRWNTLSRTGTVRGIARGVFVLMVAGGIALAARAVPETAPTQDGAAQDAADIERGVDWEPYRADRVQSYIDRGEPVFINFTATWCLSCQANKRVALKATSVRNAFATQNVHLVEADWTRQDPAITDALAAYGRRSVPLYVFYPGGEQQEPQVLPELLTPGIVLDALANANPDEGDGT